MTATVGVVGAEGVFAGVGAVEKAGIGESTKNGGIYNV
jgi:hypothetical protein